MDSVGSRRLDRHLKKTGTTLEGFAGKLGTSKALVSYWRRGMKSPGTKYVVRIERETGIPPSAWLRPVRGSKPSSRSQQTSH